MSDLSGRVAIVTGASRGIGRTIAFRLASAGALVVAGARADHAVPVAREIEAAGGVAVAVPLEVTEASSVTGMVQPGSTVSDASTCWSTMPGSCATSCCCG